jgi:hypothetical protein
MARVQTHALTRRHLLQVVVPRYDNYPEAFDSGVSSAAGQHQHQHQPCTPAPALSHC